MAKAWGWAAGAIGLIILTAGCAGTDSDDPNSAQAAERPAPRCFSARNARNFRVVDSRTVNLRVGRHVYRLDLFGACPDVSWTNSLALVTSGGSSNVCTGRGLGTSIVVRGSTGPQRCAIQSITALTTQEVQALEPRFRP